MEPNGRCALTHMTIATFNSLYPEIAEATDLGATLRSNMRESLPLENWEGTPVQVIARAVMVVMAPPLILFAVIFEARRRSRSGQK